MDIQPLTAARGFPSYACEVFLRPLLRIFDVPGIEHEIRSRQPTLPGFPCKGVEWGSICQCSSNDGLNWWRLRYPIMLWISHEMLSHTQPSNTS